LKIVDLKTWAITANWRSLVYLKVFTDEGIVGVGESTIERNSREVLGALENFKSILIGRDPRQIGNLWQQMRMYPLWPQGSSTLAAIGGIELALWGILGKSLDVPVHQLLGGKVRDTVRSYANGWFYDCGVIGDYVDAAAAAIERSGYQALKWDPFGAVDLTMNPVEERTAVECVRAVRAAVGDDVDLMIEFHAKFDVPTAMRLCRKLEPFDPYWYEDPLRVGWSNEDAWRVLARHTRVPLMDGGSWDRWGFRRIIEGQLVQHIMPDIIHSGGLAEAVRIASMAEVYGMTCHPHHGGGAPGRAATLQFAAVVPNCLILEHQDSQAEHPAAVEVSNRQLPPVRNGFIDIPNEPGRGVDRDNGEELAERFPYRPEMDSPTFARNGFSVIDPHPVREEDREMLRTRDPRQWTLGRT